MSETRTEYVTRDDSSTAVFYSRDGIKYTTTGGYVSPEPCPRYADLRLAVRHVDGHCVPRAIIVDESDGEQISEVLLLRLAEHIVETFNAVPALVAERDALAQRVASYETETAELREQVTRLQAEISQLQRQDDGAGRMLRTLRRWTRGEL